MFFLEDGKLISSVYPDALLGMDSVERPADLPKPSVLQRKAHDAVQALAREHQLAVQVKPGDLLFVNNRSILHGREPFQDTVERTRYLVRMWLKNEELAWKLPQSLHLEQNAVFYDEECKANWNIAPAGSDQVDGGDQAEGGDQTEAGDPKPVPKPPGPGPDKPDVIP